MIGNVGESIEEACFASRLSIETVNKGGIGLAEVPPFPSNGTSPPERFVLQLLNSICRTMVFDLSVDLVAIRCCYGDGSKALVWTFALQSTGVWRVAGYEGCLP